MNNSADRPTGVLLLNLGGPDSLRAVKPFLFNLFSDREIIRLGPSLLQKPIAWLISSLRGGKTEKYYSLIGGKSPICDITFAQAKALEEELNKSQSVELPLHPPLSKGGQEGDKRPLYFFGSVKARFLHPVVPGDQIKIKMINVKTLPTGAYVSGEAFVEDKKISEAELVFSVKKDE